MADSAMFANSLTSNYDDSAYVQIGGDKRWVAAIFDGPIAQKGDVVEMVCTQADDTLKFKLRVVRKADAAGEV